MSAGGPTAPHDVLTMGRIGVDVYPLQVGVSLREVESFGKYLGGSATNVAVAAARYGRRSAVITRTGADPFGAFLHDALRRFGVDDRYVTEVAGLPTPVTFCEIFPPDDFPLYFYREPKAPDLEIRPEELDLDAIRAARVFWVTVTGLSQEPSRSATLAALEARGRQSRTAGRRPSLSGRGAGRPAEVLHTILDLDYRPMFWPSREEARARVAAGPAARHRGGRQPRRVRHRRRRARAARGRRRRCASAASTWPWSSRAPRACWPTTATTTVEVPPVPVEVVNGLGAGDAFGGALCHGLLAGWEVERIMRFCNAAGALVAARLACADAMPEEHEVDALLGEAVDA